jgi:menaquinone-dependent protoporphyrinogen IX oxidase
MPAKILVIYYSRSENTHRLAEAIARALGNCDLERIRDTVRRDGVRGYLRSGRQAFFEQEVELLPLEHPPANYDLVVVGTPIWNWSLSAPVRSLLQKERNRWKQVAFFLTYETSGKRRVFSQMQSIVGREPLARMAMHGRDVGGPRVAREVQKFVEEIRRALGDQLTQPRDASCVRA